MAEAATIRPRAPQLLATALGINLWLTMLVVPALYLRAAAASAGTLVAVCALALALLAAGILRRSLLLLLLLFPASLLVGPLLEPALAGPSVYTPATLLPCAAALLLHLGGALWLGSTVGTPAAPARVQALTAPLRAPVSLRRFRLYRALAILAAFFPAAFLVAVHYRPRATADLERAFGASAPVAAALVTLLALALWLGLFFVYFVRPLAIHLDGDRVTMAENLEVRRRLVARRPRLTLYLTMLVALALMAALFALRYR
ncbi:MAG: hypothetical protein HY906_18100 [Deltaproteobacteria bacterium]|nr:hypothetical protein [Deltaproteobacteria bacterium]